MFIQYLPLLFQIMLLKIAIQNKAVLTFYLAFIINNQDLFISALDNFVILPPEMILKLALSLAVINSFQKIFTVKSIILLMTLSMNCLNMTFTILLILKDPYILIFQESIPLCASFSLFFLVNVDNKKKTCLYSVLSYLSLHSFYNLNATFYFKYISM